jgi:chromate reductase, NAD(P)H dehydrogenase (quinone)
VRTLRGEIAAAHGLLIGTPEHNRAPPGLLKNVIDWLSGPAPEEILAAKPIAINGASGGPWGTRLAQAALFHRVLAVAESDAVRARVHRNVRSQRTVD